MKLKLGVGKGNKLERGKETKAERQVRLSQKIWRFIELTPWLKLGTEGKGMFG